MEFVAKPEMRFLVDSWEYFLIQILKDRLEACRKDQAMLPQVHLPAKVHMEDSMDDIVRTEDGGVHKGTVCDEWMHALVGNYLLDYRSHILSLQRCKGSGHPPSQ